MSRKCAKCGIVSDIEESFQKSYYPDEMLYRSIAWDVSSIKNGASVWIASCILLIGGFLWVISNPQNDIAWLVFQAGLLVFLSIILTLAHELGHTIAAFLTKAKIFQVTVGLGNILFKRDFLGIEWVFRVVPFSGVTIVGFNNRNLYRLRSFLVSLGGPLANFILIFPAIFLLFNVSSPWLLAFIRPFIAANVLAVISGLLPRKTTLSGISMQSDGLSLLTIPFKTDSEINHEIESCFAWEIYSSYTKNRFNDAMHSFEKGITLFPESSALKNEMGKMLYYQGKYVEARNIFVPLLQKTDLTDDMRNGILNGIAAADVTIGGNDLLEEADVYSKTACENMPWQTEFKWTRGLVLVQKGDIKQALPLLREVMEKAENPSQKAEYAFYIADLEKQN